MATVQNSKKGVASRKLEEWFGWGVDTELEYSRLARSRLSPTTVSILEDIGFSRDETSWIISPRAISERIRSQKMLTVDESAKVIRLARLAALAENVFGGPEKARRWLSKSKRKLNGLTPLEATKDEFGARVVTQMLIEIDSGMY
ncbi:DUF2384 domain-containing protein [Aliidiomarina halalkaliphila]|uniref:DUF2384 domain-containing protein n=1 Tax=Aliidiomarina halalkaliphila TaxID=2593535 RepID=A0A552X1J4_9GAMM|nr:MbcA/ParS/Xre antitoxin family protein [Aliidiomarina halalkaliphila]TRW48912.1 DUF2384 domain-containing protein [Aliidiomarina halalkaliphila]